jgi:hypothetical protein
MMWGAAISYVRVFTKNENQVLQISYFFLSQQSV